LKRPESITLPVKDSTHMFDHPDADMGMSKETSKFLRNAEKWAAVLVLLLASTLVAAVIVLVYSAVTHAP